MKGVTIPFSRTGILLILLIGLCTIAACVKEPEPPKVDTPDSSFGLIYDKILTPSCGVNGCHDGASIHPRLSGENTYRSMVTDHLHNHDAEQAGLHLVKPFDADSSFLYQKMIFDSTEFKFGSPMPQGNLTVTANQIRFLRQWIEAGAPEEGHVADRTLIE